MEKELVRQKRRHNPSPISSRFKPDPEACQAQKHPLEGKYIIYKYGQQDSVGEGWALALFMLKDGKMAEVYHPMNEIWAEACSMGEQNVEELMKLMEKIGIKEVYTVFHIKDFFGIPANWFSLHEKDPKPPKQIEYWAEYQPICKDEYEHQVLAEKGIRLRFYDENLKMEI
jgi:hypothetical protein